MYLFSSKVLGAQQSNDRPVVRICGNGVAAADAGENRSHNGGLLVWRDVKRLRFLSIRLCAIHR